MPESAADAVPRAEDYIPAEREYDLSDRNQRARAYEIVLREGGPEDIRDYVDGALLADQWPDLVLPLQLRSAWQPLIDAARGNPAA